MDAAAIHQENESKINREEACYLYGDAIVCIAPRYACSTDSSRACMGIAGFVPSACADNAHIVSEPNDNISPTDSFVSQQRIRSRQIHGQSRARFSAL